MVFESRRPANIPKPKKRKPKVEDDEEEILAIKVEEPKFDRRNRPTVGNIKNTKTNGNGHNCPEKDGPRTHPFSPRCIAQKHCGYCPICNHLESYKYGCPFHRVKKEDLLKEPVSESEMLRRARERRSQKALSPAAAAAEDEQAGNENDDVQRARGGRNVDARNRPQEGLGGEAINIRG